MIDVLEAVQVCVRSLLQFDISLESPLLTAEYNEAFALGIQARCGMSSTDMPQPAREVPHATLASSACPRLPKKYGQTTPLPCLSNLHELREVVWVL